MESYGSKGWKKTFRWRLEALRAGLVVLGRNHRRARWAVGTCWYKLWSFGTALERKKWGKTVKACKSTSQNRNYSQMPCTLWVLDTVVFSLNIKVDLLSELSSFVLLTQGMPPAKQPKWMSAFEKIGGCCELSKPAFCDSRTIYFHMRVGYITGNVYKPRWG